MKDTARTTKRGQDERQLVRQAKAPVVCETPNGAAGQGADIGYLRKHLS